VIISRDTIIPLKHSLYDKPYSRVYYTVSVPKINSIHSVASTEHLVATDGQIPSHAIIPRYAYASRVKKRAHNAQHPRLTTVFKVTLG